MKRFVALLLVSAGCLFSVSPAPVFAEMQPGTTLPSCLHQDPGFYYDYLKSPPPGVSLECWDNYTNTIYLLRLAYAADIAWCLLEYSDPAARCLCFENKGLQFKIAAMEAEEDMWLCAISQN